MNEELLLIDPRKLRPHERINPARALWVLIKITTAGRLTTPILIDTRSMTILDGHHRSWAAKVLGFKRIPCWSVDYLNDEAISVLPRRPEIPVSKLEVLRRAASGEVYPYKTTKHKYTLPDIRAFTISELRDAQNN